MIDNLAYDMRGVSYFSKRKVLAFQWDTGDRIVGRVSGSGRQVYSDDVKLSSGADGELSDVDGHCACPTGYSCKHVVAILLDSAHRIVDVARSLRQRKIPIVPSPRRSRKQICPAR